MKSEYTIKEIADELETSKTTVSKIIKKLNISPQKKRVNNQDITIISVEDSNKIKNDFFDRHPIPKTEDEVDTNLQTNAENQGINLQTNAENQGINLQTVNKAMELLEQQLNKKDETIADLQSKLAEAYNQISKDNQTIAELAAKAQYITAADKTERLLDLKQDNQNNSKRKSLFKFWK